MKIKGLRWWIISLICVATIINYIDRSALAIMWPDIQAELGLTKDDYAWVINIFMFAYAIGKLISGRIYDIVGTKIGFILSIFFWSLAALLHAFARGVTSLGLFRGLLGVSEAGPWPGVVKSNAEWFPINERAVAQGIFNSGAAIGSIIAAPAVAEMTAGFGWKTTFIIIGVMGFLWIIPWMLINQNKAKNHPWITDAELNLIETGQEEKQIVEEETLSIGKILSYKESLGVILSQFFLEPIWWLFVFWMPIYLFEQYGFNVKEIGYYAWIPYVGAAFGSLAGGFYVKKLILTMGVDIARKRVIFIGNSIIFVSIMTAIFFADTPEKFVSIVFITLFGFQFSISNLQIIPSDLLGGKSVGTLAGLAGGLGAISVIIMNFLVPVITKTSYTPAFVILAVLAPLSFFALHFLCEKIKPLNNTFK